MAISNCWDEPEGLPVVSGLRVKDRELLMTTVIDARPELREPSPAASIWPLVSAIALTGLLVGSVFTPWAVVWGAIPVAAALTLWFWPKERRPTSAEPVVEA